MINKNLVSVYLPLSGQICGPRKEAPSSETTQLTEEDTAPLMGDVAVHIPTSVRFIKPFFLIYPAHKC